MGLFTKIKDYMLGTDYEDDFYEEDYYEEEYDDEYEEPSYKKTVKEREAERERAASVDYATTRVKKNNTDSKVLTLPTYNTDLKTKIIICRPEVVDDATSICDHLKNSILCVVNLEGVERANAQRIADFLGGACYAVSGEIQRISNDIFLIAPANISITSQMKDKIKDSNLILPWIAAFK